MLVLHPQEELVNGHPPERVDTFSDASPLPNGPRCMRCVYADGSVRMWFRAGQMAGWVETERLA
jgi:hypothetical protein